MQRRSEFIGGAAIGAAAAAGVVAIGIPAFADSASEGDVAVLNALLLVERVLAAYHRQAADTAIASGDLQTYLDRAATHDERHVDELVAALGSDAEAEPTIGFDDTLFASPQAIATAAGDLKDIAIAGYNGHAGSLSAAGIALTSRLVAIDSRHAGWIRTLAGVELVAPQPTDPGIDAREVRSRLHDLGVRIGG
ncbi:MAG: ferritin-like domain-containing protein [Thermoleophilia bacterium]|nr:ferritin-like domain-containing protein [Thermoleophilia bacterium]